jgi:hypothetical protein
MRPNEVIKIWGHPDKVSKSADKTGEIWSYKQGHSVQFQHGVVMAARRCEKRQVPNLAKGDYEWRQVCF